MAKYFDKIYCHKNVIGVGDIGSLYICEGFNGIIEDNDKELFKKIIFEWNKIEPGDGYDIKDKYVSSIIYYYVDSKIDIHINNKYKEKENSLLKKIRFFDNIFNSIDDVTDDILIEYSDSMNEMYNHRVVGVAHKYNIPVKDECIVKIGTRNNHITNVLKYQNTIIYGLTMQNKNNISNINNNNFSYLVNKINIYKFGLKISNKTKWKNIINVLTVSSLLLSKFSHKNPLLFAELKEIDNFIFKYNYKTISYNFYNDEPDDISTYLFYKINNKNFDIGVLMGNIDNNDFVNNVNIGGSLIIKIKMPNDNINILLIIYHYSNIFSNVFFVRPSVTPLDSLYVYIICVNKLTNTNKLIYNNEISNEFLFQYYNISNIFTELFIEYIKAIYYGIDNELYVDSIYDTIQSSHKIFSDIWFNVNIK